MSGTDTPLLYVDVTTAWQEASTHPHGTTRVERGVVDALAKLDLAHVRFFRFERAAGRYVAVPTEAAGTLADSVPQADGRRELRRPPGRLGIAARRLEKWVRRSLRDPWRRRRALGLSTTPSAVPFERGSRLLFASEINRHDYGALMRLRRDLELTFAIVFFDAHNVLARGDPRLADARASDIPNTDFMLREAALLLSISQFSTGQLHALVETRGTTAPPIRQIRLAGRLPRISAPRPLAGLEPGRFVLTVGDVTVRKNHAMLFEAWRRLTMQEASTTLPLVCVGRIAPEIANAVARVRADERLRQAIRFEPNLDDAGLAWLYANCRFTVFASLHEGFGLPVAESLALGKPCIASSAEAIPEAGQGLAISLDPRDVDAWVRTAGALMRDDALLAEQSGKIAAHFHAVSWVDTAADILDAIDAQFGQDAAGRGR